MPAGDHCVGNVSPEALAGWEAFADRHGLMRAPLLEAIGLYLADLERPPPFLGRAIERAREIQSDRRSRAGIKHQRRRQR